MKIEEKLYLNRFQTDKVSHLKVLDPEYCLNECKTKPCTYICPSKVYEWNKQEKMIMVAYEGCVECGTCRYACPDNIDWQNPRGGFGVLYKFG